MTQIQSGSLKELWKVSSSLMISFLSMFGMVFIDRLFLAHYSTEALTASVSAGTLFWAVAIGCLTLASLAEVFVAQYNGAKKYAKLGEPVWQMIWLAIGSFMVFFPIAHWGSFFLEKHHLINTNEALYFRFITYFAPLFSLSSALNAFYVGQGKTAVVKWMGLLGNGVNCILDPILIFGIKGMIPSYGVKGAAIATGLGISVQVVVVFMLFLSKNNRLKFGSDKWRFRVVTFQKCLKVGTPPAIFVTFELFGWALFYWMMGKISTEHIFVAGVCQSIVFLFLFFGIGLEKGAAAVAGNLIGAGKWNLVKNVWHSGLKLNFIFSLILIFFFIFFPDLLLKGFIKNPTAEMSSASLLDLLHAKSLIKTGLIMVAVYIFIENIRWLLSGILTSAGDTFFLMISGVISVWGFMILPIYYFMLIKSHSINVAFVIWIIYSVLATLVNFLRFVQGKWKEKNLIKEEKAVAFVSEEINS